MEPAPQPPSDATTLGLRVRRLRFGTIEESVGPGRDHHLALHLAGVCRLQRPIDGRWRDFHPRPGSLSLAAAGGDGRFRSVGEADVLKATLPAAALSRALDDLGGASGEPDLTARTALDDPLCRELVLALWREAHDDRAGGAYRAAAEWTLALRVARLLLTKPDPKPKGALVGWRLRRATAFMEARITTGFSLPELAAELGLSVSHLCAGFKAATGTTVMRHFALLRLERARRALLDEPVSVAQVAARLGYSSPARFGQAFRKAFGAPPARYRRGRMD